MICQRTRSVVLIALAVAVHLAATACGEPTGRSPITPTMNTTSAESAAQYRDMQARPNIDQITERYDEMRAAIRERLASEVGLAPWVKDDEFSRAGCRDFPAVDQKFKESRGLALWALESNIPDEKWPIAVRIVTEIAAGYGFGNLITVVDQPGHHQISLSDQYGGELRLGTRVHSTLAGRTGCHLVAEPAQTGSSTSPPTSGTSTRVRPT